ncbi:MAG: hypothetical protein HYY37_05185 [Candidatus Aenigmarchaeota archaeon]|nr:hypothetical protein [Candidatus Aenigmarchaeota archaeon]
MTADIWLPRARSARGYLYDSMDTIRSSQTNALFPSAPVALKGHYRWASSYGKYVGLVTNGPFMNEWIDFAAACLEGWHAAPSRYETFTEKSTISTPLGSLAVYRTAQPVTGQHYGELFGITDGGGVLGRITPEGVHEKVIMVSADRVAALKELKIRAAEDPFMGRLLSVYGTPYDTASVITLRGSLEEFRSTVGDVIPRSLDKDLAPENWVERMLLWLGDAYGESTARIGPYFAPCMTKIQNRRVYQYPDKTFNGLPMDKKNGTRAAELVLGVPILGNHVYTSDRLESPPERVMREGDVMSVDVTGNDDFAYDAATRTLIVGRFDQFTEALAA